MFSNVTLDAVLKIVDSLPFSMKKECALEIVEVQQCLLKKMRSAASLEDSETQHEVGSSPAEPQSQTEQTITKLVEALISQGYVHDVRPFSKSKRPVSTNSNVSTKELNTFSSVGKKNKKKKSKKSKKKVEHLDSSEFEALKALALVSLHSDTEYLADLPVWLRRRMWESQTIQSPPELVPLIKVNQVCKSNGRGKSHDTNTFTSRTSSMKFQNLVPMDMSHIKDFGPETSPSTFDEICVAERGDKKQYQPTRKMRKVHRSSKKYGNRREQVQHQSSSTQTDEEFEALPIGSDVESQTLSQTIAEKHFVQPKAVNVMQEESSKRNGVVEQGDGPKDQNVVNNTGEEAPSFLEQLNQFGACAHTFEIAGLPSEALGEDSAHPELSELSTDDKTQMSQQERPETIGQFLTIVEVSGTPKIQLSPSSRI